MNITELVEQLEKAKRIIGNLPAMNNIAFNYLDCGDGGKIKVNVSAYSMDCSIAEGQKALREFAQRYSDANWKRVIPYAGSKNFEWTGMVDGIAFELACIEPNPEPVPPPFDPVVRFQEIEPAPLAESVMTPEEAAAAGEFLRNPTIESARKLMGA